MQNVDVLIIGKSLTGRLAAWQLSKKGIPVTLIETPHLQEHHFCQAGIMFQGIGDSIENRIEDLIRLGEGHACPKAVEHLATKGAECVEELCFKALQLPFDRNVDGSMALSTEQGHSFPRTIRIKDQSYKYLIAALDKKIAQEDNITIRKLHFVDFLTLANSSTQRKDVYCRPTCLGAQFYDEQSKQMVSYLAKETVLAQGGLGQLFNDPCNYGSELFLANCSGARIVNLHYLNYWPVALKFPGIQLDVPIHANLLKTAIFKTDGGKTVDVESVISPNELASQLDLEKRKLGAKCLFMDLTHLKSDSLKTEFPHFVHLCETTGINPMKSPIPMTPYALGSTGGIQVDTAGQTSIQRLFAIGDVAATGVFGKLRQPSVSFLEQVVWTQSCSNEISRRIEKFAYYFPEISPHAPFDTETGRQTSLIHNDWNYFKSVITHYLGPNSDRGSILRTRSRLEHLKQEIDRHYPDRTFEKVALCQTINMAMLLTETLAPI